MRPNAVEITSTKDMTFIEKKKENGYDYYCEDVFGKVEIDSPEKLKGEMLDEIVSVLLKVKSPAKEVTGQYQIESGLLKYKLTKAPAWSEDEEKEPCENTLTSRKEAGKEFIRIKNYADAIISWFQRFAEAFREAWKKTT